MPGPNTSRFERFLKKDGLHDDKIMAIEGDAAGRIWASTAGHGIFCIDTSTINGERAIRHFSKKDGLVSNDFLLSSVYRSEDGTLFLGSENGLQIFHPDAVFKPLSVKSQLFFTKFDVLGTNDGQEEPQVQLDSSINFVKTIRISAGRTTLAFRFAALGFLKEDNVQYSYYLKNKGGDIGTLREIVLTQLTPGKHTLEVKAKHEKLPEEGIAATLELIVEPFCYQTLGARIAGFLCLALFLYWLYKFRIKRKLEAAEARHLRNKNKWYKYITHKLGDPLTVILAMADEVANNPNQWFEKGMQAIKRNGWQLHHLVKQLLDLTKLEFSTLPVKNEQGDVILFFRYLVEPFQIYAKSKDVSLHFLTEMDEYLMDYDPDKLLKIVSNLLSNAIKFTPPNGDIFFQVAEEKRGASTFLKIIVKDTGLGIPPDKLPHIFDLFYQADNPQRRQGEGTGIGLTLTRELVHLLDGTIGVDSRNGAGTTFRVQLPVNRNDSPTAPVDYLKGGWPEILSYLEALTFKAPVEEEPPAKEEKELKLLIIEDNQDIYELLKASLAPYYQITNAGNGQLGIEKAIEMVPDIIISDVIMPEKNGFEVCETLKNHELTGHIPIVLLTARADDESEVSGLKSLADAYLPKPFHKEKLLAQLENLIEQREKLQSYYLKALSPSVQEDVSAEINDPWLRRIISLIEENMSDPDFGVEELARIGRIDRSHLWKKVKALTSMSTQALIRSRRLIKAKSLLLSTKLSVKEITDETGFRGQSQFSHVFKAEFKLSPTDFRDEHRGLDIQ